MSVSKIKIKADQVKVPKIETYDDRFVVAKDWFSIPYSNIFISASKKSGKTILIYNIMQKCAGKNTKVFIFCPTFENDKTYKAIIEMLEDKGCTVECFKDLDDLHDVTQNLSIDEPEEEEYIDKEIKVIYGGKIITVTESKKINKKKDKKVYAKNIIIFDDISPELKNVGVAALLKINRHLHSKVIISSQHLYDITPQCRGQIDYLCLFPGISFKRLENLYTSMDCHTDIENFLKYYRDATSKRFNFLMYDKGNNEFRKNFTELYQ